MSNKGILYWIGVADGVVLAGVTALGQAVPAWQPYTQVATEVLGFVATMLAGFHAARHTGGAS